MEKLVIYGWIGFGSALGGIGRYWISAFMTQRFPAFPIGTLLVNVTGSFLIGLFATLTGPEGRVMAGARTNHFFMTGLCGGFTTFSSFSLQTISLAREGQMANAAVNVASSIFLCLAAVWIGHLTGQAINR